MDEDMGFLNVHYCHECAELGDVGGKTLLVLELLDLI